MIKKMLEKYREMIAYLFFGVLTTAVNWVSYAVCVSLLGIGITIGNVISWIVAVVFAFVTNKCFVFESRSWKRSVLIPEFGKFVSARLITGVMEMVLVPLLVRLGLNQTILGVEGMAAKVLVSVLVVILNYVFSKLFIFRQK